MRKLSVGKSFLIWLGEPQTQAGTGQDRPWPVPAADAHDIPQALLATFTPLVPAAFRSGLLFLRSSSLTGCSCGLPRFAMIVPFLCAKQFGHPRVVLPQRVTRRREEHRSQGDPADGGILGMPVAEDHLSGFEPVRLTDPRGRFGYTALIKRQFCGGGLAPGL